MASGRYLVATGKDPSAPFHSGKGWLAMRNWVLASLLFMAGCQSAGGSLGYGKPSRAGGLSIDEQKVASRERYPLIEDDKLSVRTYVDRPSPVGR